MRRWILPALLALSLCACSTNNSAPATKEPDACEGEGFGCTVDIKPAESSFHEISFDDAIALFENGQSGLLYFGFTGCPWCREVVPLLAEEARNAGVEVQFVRTRDDERNRLYTDEQKEKILPYLQEYMSENKDGEMTLYVPLVVAVDQGKAVAGHVGTVDGHDAKEREMTEQEKEEADRMIKEITAKAAAATAASAS